MKKKIKKLALLAVVLLTASPMSAYDFEVDGIYYDVVSLSELTCEVVQHSSYSGDIMIPATVNYNNRALTVVKIADKAFYGRTGLKSMTIGNFVAKIGNSAFENCTNLTSVTIGNSVAEIGSSAFKNCTNLTTVAIGNSVAKINLYAFQNCSSLTSLTIPNSVTEIDNYVFNGCSKLESVTIEDGETTLNLGYNTKWTGQSGKGLFCDCPITKLYLGRNLSHDRTWTAYSPFYNIQTIHEVTISNSVTKIEGDMFVGCSGLTSMTIPNSVVTIGDYAFYNCSGLTSMTIPNSVVTIGKVAFKNCTGLKSVTIGNSVAEIGYYAFENCTRLTSLTIPNSVIKIDDGVFNGCSNIEQITFKDGKTTLSLGCNALGNSSYGSEGKGLFYDCPITTVYVGRNISYNTDYYYGYSPFYRNGKLKEITIGNSVTSIGDYALYRCINLESVTIGNSVTSIGKSAFSGCSGLTSLYSLNTTPPSIGSDNFTNNHYINLNVYVPQEALSAYQNDYFWKNFWNLQGSNLTGIETPLMNSGERAIKEVYDLSGKQLSQPQRGLNIVKMSDGTTKKITVK